LYSDSSAPLHLLAAGFFHAPAHTFANLQHSLKQMKVTVGVALRNWHGGEQE
jgi:hypothetical protein